MLLLVVIMQILILCNCISASLCNTVFISYLNIIVKSIDWLEVTCITKMYLSEYFLKWYDSCDMDWIIFDTKQILIARTTCASTDVVQDMAITCMHTCHRQ